MELDNIERELAEALVRKGGTMATAESCTGGNIAHRITLMAGSSAYFLGGVVSYANAVKENVLGVSGEVLERCGAVSREVVEQMAEGVCRALGSDFGVATSGIAGPGGGSAEKPVGMVWMAASRRNGADGGFETVSEVHYFEGERAEIIEKASGAAIFLLKNIVIK